MKRRIETVVNGKNVAGTANLTRAEFGGWVVSNVVIRTSVRKLELDEYEWAKKAMYDIANEKYCK